MGAVDIIDAEVRELIRRRGLDPAREPGSVRALIDDVLTEYEVRALTATLPALGDRQRVARVVHDSVAGFGPLQRFLDDPTIEEIWVNGPGRVFVARRGRSELTTTILTSAHVQELVERMLKSSGRRVDLSTPFVDAMLPDGFSALCKLTRRPGVVSTPGGATRGRTRLPHRRWISGCLLSNWW